MNSALLNLQDVGRVVERLPKDVAGAMQREPRLWLAGGFIRAVIANEPVRDIDLFVSDEVLGGKLTGQLAKGGHRECEALAFNDKEHRIYKLTSTAEPAAEVQVCVGWHAESPAHLIAEFDFTVCKAAIWWEAGMWRSASSLAFYEHLRARQLVIDNPESVPSLMRMVRYCRRGYDVDEVTVRMIVAGECARAINGHGLLSGEERYRSNDNGS